MFAEGGHCQLSNEEVTTVILLEVVTIATVMISRSSSIRLSRIRSSTHHRKSCRPQRLIKRDQKQVRPFPACHSWARWTPIQNFTACAVYRSKPKVWSQNHNNMLHLPKHAQCTVRLFSGSSQCQGGKCKYLTGGSKQSPFWRS